MSEDKDQLTVLERRAAAQRWREEKATQYRKALRSSVLGLEIMIFVLMGGGIGYYIDNQYETTPWAFWIGSFIGISGAVKTMVVVIREYNRAYGDSDEEASPSESSRESEL